MGFLIGTIVTLFVLLSLFLILLVMIQTGKGGSAGMLGGSTASQSVFGASTADVMTKTTRVSAILFILLSLTLSFLFAKKDDVLLPEVEPTLEAPVDATNTNEATPVTPSSPAK
ncbi:preprotein translocase subunit SecG [Leptospira ilyithenensis]|uniref:Protein-export membrane protein SecG n=1 Tax=Leptospira ilyithenensis TaxID=2484901 RepID=A0A4V3JWZ8_9LEPT|nr:preprotein translocase subunit SecG [Leptospira ilyithenensis]TGN10001.1 preprotein translocase subunit SecG [Leptospira ilyithenensis]